MGNKKKYYELSRSECISEINQIMENTDDLWILWQIYRLAVNILR